jgi:P pilus assembly chaperone PapD
MKKTLLLLFVCLFVGISHAQAQVTVKGTVISSEQRTGNRSFCIGKRNNQWNNHRHQW